MHPKLCSFPSREFYNSELLTAPGTKEARPVPRIFFGGHSPLRFIDVPDGNERRLGSGSWFNEVEIDKIETILRELLSDGELCSSQITVLTFYRAQQLKLRERLSGWTSGTSPEVSSVDGYQGKENEVIVLSAVRSRDSLGFCGDPRRVNVVLTRAKCGLIVVGKRATLQTSPLWTRWLMDVE